MPAGFVVLLHGGLALLMDRDGWVGVLVPGAAERVGGPSKARFTFRIHLRLTCTSRNSGGRPTPSSPGSKLARIIMLARRVNAGYARVGQLAPLRLPITHAGFAHRLVLAGAGLELGTVDPDAPSGADRA